MTFIALAVLGMSGLRGDSGSAVLPQPQKTLLRCLELHDSSHEIDDNE